jgi:hypothetical protein
VTREELLDIDPTGDPEAWDIALRHAWNWAVEAENPENTEIRASTDAAVSQAWSAIAEALK